MRGAVVMSDTPRTDALRTDDYILTRNDCLIGMDRYREFARKLERENAQLREIAYIVAVRGLQTDAYGTDMDFRDAVDDALAATKQARGALEAK
jgi:hypothetical protein